MTKLKFGLVYSLRSPSGGSQELFDLYSNVIEEVQLAEKLGFSTFLVCEHHFTEDSFFPSSLVSAAGIASRTTKIRVGSFVLLPLHNSIRVAEDGAVLDIISRGRFVLGLGLGWRDAEFENFSVPLSERYSRFKEGAQLIERLWTEDRVTFEGRYAKLKEASLTPKPLQVPHPPIWIGAKGDSLVRVAATLGLSWFPPPSLDIDTIRAKLELFRRVLDIKDRSENVNIEYPLFREGYVSLNDELAFEEAKIPLMYTRRKYWEWWHRENWNEETFLRYRESMMIGGADLFISQAEKYAKELGTTELMIALNHPGMKPSNILRAIRLIGEKVIPYFN